MVGLLYRALSKDRPAPDAPEPLSPLIDAHTHLSTPVVRTTLRPWPELSIEPRPSASGRVVTVADDLDAARFAVDAANWDSRGLRSRRNPSDQGRTSSMSTPEPRSSVWRPIRGSSRVGETGLDLYWPGKLEGCATIEEQVDGFRVAHRPREASRQDADDSQSRSRSGPAAGAARGRRAGGLWCSTASPRIRRWPVRASTRATC